MDFIAQELPQKGDTVVVGLSGGVDSTLTALLLKERGCHVIGATMSLWDGTLPEIKTHKPLKESCYGPDEKENIAECQKFCARYGIEYHIIDVKEAYNREVLQYFKAEYRAGRTPNPCIRCNRFIKFGALLEGIQKLSIDFDYFCTGHYARVVRPSEGLWNTDVRPYMIAGAADVSKDQTYFLYRLPSDILKKVRFPLAGIKKSEVFELARKAGLDAAERAESQNFVGEEYFDLLFADKESVPGDIIDLDGHVLGRHRGIEHYTIGQRRGLGVSSSRPMYVHSIDAKNNVVVLAPNDSLNASGLIANEFVWPGDVEPAEPFEAMVKIRLASRPAKAIVQKAAPEECDSASNNNLSDDNMNGSTAWKVMFETPQRAVAPGQSVVLYNREGVVIGGGIIARRL